MSRLGLIDIHPIATDGLPDMEKLTGRVAFIFDGCIVSGWPLDPTEHADLYASHGWDAAEDGVLWEPNEDVGRARPFGNVTHWVEFPIAIHEIAATS